MPSAVGPVQEELCQGSFFFFFCLPEVSYHLIMFPAEVGRVSSAMQRSKYVNLCSPIFYKVDRTAGCSSLLSYTRVSTSWEPMGVEVVMGARGTEGALCRSPDGHGISCLESKLLSHPHPIHVGLLLCGMCVVIYLHPKTSGFALG